MSYTPTNEEGYAVRPAAGAAAADRMDFIRKVYSLLLLGLMAFGLTIAIPIQGYLSGNETMKGIVELAFTVPPWLALLLIIGSSFVVHSISMMKGINLVGLFGFAMLWGFLSIPLVALAGLGGFEIVGQAVLLTGLVFGGLTMYVFMSRRDFSFMGGFLWIGMMVALGLIVINMIGASMGWEVTGLSMGISAGLVVLMGLYVLYDTSNVLHHYATDMVVPAALALMVDFIIMFRSILFLLMRGRD